MAGKARKDSKGYVLHKGETQRSDGRYSYSFTDKQGVRHTKYAPSLVELRRIEKEIERSRLDGIDPFAADKLSINDMYDRYMSQKFDLKPTTKSNYIYMYNRFVRESFSLAP